MANQSLPVSARVNRKLQDIARSMGGGSVQVGFLEGATYPDGTPVAAVAFWNEFGTSRIPARPFFRGMIAKESSGWAVKMAAMVKATNYDGPKVLALMGEDISGALSQSITNFSSPKNAPSTIKKKGFDKPLIDTADMLRAVSYEVKR